MSVRTGHAPVRLGVVFENTVGHVTFAHTLATVIARRPDVTATFHPISTTPRGLIDRTRPLQGNWTLHSSLDTRALFLRRRRDYDALLFHTQTLAQLSAGVMRRIPSIISLDATPANIDEVGAGYDHHRDSASREAFKRLVVRRPLLAASRLVAWSEWVRRSLLDDYAVEDRRITVVPAGTDIGRHPASRGERRPGPPRVLFVGGAFARKGGPLLLDAIARLPSVECDVVTHDPPAAAERVRVHTGLSPGDPRIDRLYADADVFVLPTRGDASPHALLEAMAAGVPVITTRVGAIPEVVRDGDTGLLIESDDSDALTEALQRLCEDPALARTLGARGRSHVAAHFDAYRNVERVLDLARDIIRPAAQSGEDSRLRI